MKVRGCCTHCRPRARKRCGDARHVSSLRGAASPDTLDRLGSGRQSQVATGVHGMKVRGCCTHCRPRARKRCGDARHVSSLRGAASPDTLDRLGSGRPSQVPTGVHGMKVRGCCTHCRPRARKRCGDARHVSSLRGAASLVIDHLTKITRGIRALRRIGPPSAVALCQETVSVERSSTWVANPSSASSR